jgi:hypothetical protein
VVLGDGGGSGGGPWRPLGVDCARRQRCLERSWALAALDATRRLLCWAAAAITLCVSRARWYDLGMALLERAEGERLARVPAPDWALAPGARGGQGLRLRGTKSWPTYAFWWLLAYLRLLVVAGLFYAFLGLGKAQLAPLLLQPREPL